MVPLESGFPSAFSIAWDVSEDGTAIVGVGDFGVINSRRAFLWTSDETAELIEPPFPADFSHANSISGNGLVMVGDLGWPVQVFRWTKQDGLALLGDLPGGDFYSIAKDSSADGSIIVGAGTSANSSSWEAFRWTGENGMVGLGDLPGGRFDSIGWGVSADGSLVVGWSSTDDGPTAFLWSESTGMLSLREFLVEHQVTNVAGWSLSSATGISADGGTIVGTGINPQGDSEAWVATIPEPATFFLAALAVTVSAGFCFRRPVCEANRCNSL
jgi:probable HAF family extracellular repeat protein